MPGLAQAKTKSVNLGLPANAVKQFQSIGTDVNDFFPHGITIHKGDKIRFLPTGFHSFDFPARGGQPIPLVSPTGQTVSGSNDAAGNPFWFNGQDQLAFTPSLLAGNFGKKLTYNAKKQIISGLPLADKPKPITVTFKKTGRFTYYCNIHPGMKGTVTVRPKRKNIPTKKADKKALKRQVARSLKTAQGLSKAVPPAGTIDIGVAGKRGEEFFGFVPSAVTVRVGETLSFRMSPTSRELHTATTGPGNPDDANSYIGQIVAGFNQPVFDPRAVYPSEQPPTTGTLTPLLHGNGFWNTGALDRDANTRLPASNSVTFGAPGKYDFYCVVHPFMKATVTVQ